MTCNTDHSAREIIAEMVRLSEMGIEDLVRQPEENGNFAVYERAKRFLAHTARPDAGDGGDGV